MESWIGNIGRAGNETKRNETKRNENTTRTNVIEQKRTKADESGTIRDWPPIVPTRRDEKRDEVARFVETV